MANPADWGAVPAEIDGPAKWGAVPASASASENEFGSDEYINAKAKKFGMSPDYVRGIANSQTSAEAVKGFPIVGGLANRVAAGGAALAHPLTGAGSEGSIGERYGKNLDFEKEIEADYEKSHPGTAMAANAIGGLALTGGVGMSALGARLLGLTGTTLPQMVGYGAASGAGIGAIDAAMRGENPVTGGLVGGGAGVAGPILGRGATMLAAPVVNTIRGIRNPEAEAARRVATAIGRDTQSGAAGLSPQEFAGAQTEGAPVNLMDRGGELTRALARSAANTSPEGRGELNRAINDRFEGQADRLAGWLNEQFHYPNAAAQQEALDRTAQTVNRQRYDLAHSSAEQRFPQGMWSPELQHLSSMPDVQEAMKAAGPVWKSDMARRGYGAMNAPTFENGLLNFPRNAAGVPVHPDLRYWDFVKRAMDGSVNQARRGGNNFQTMALTNQRNELVGALDNMVPEYRDVRAGAAHFFGANDALEAGQSYATSRGFNNQQVRQQLAQMSPTERQLFQDGFIDRFRQAVRSQGDRRNILNTINSNPALREKMDIVLGPQRAAQLQAFLHVEGVMDAARSAVQGNSTTARQLMELGLAGGVGGGLGLLESGGDFLSHPEAALHSALVWGALRGHARINENVARQVARLLTSGNTAQLNQGLRIVAGSPVLSAAIRNTDAALGQLVTRAGAAAAVNH